MEPLPDTPESRTDIVELLQTLWTEVLVWAEHLIEAILQPWNAYQLLIALAVFGVAHLLRSWLGPVLREWIGKQEGWPKWRLRIAAVILQRLRALVFLFLIWPTVWIMQEVTFANRSALLEIIARLSLAWLVVVFATRLIRSLAIRMIVRYGAWAYVTLSILGLLDEARVLLENAALTLGELRISLLMVVNGIVILGLLVFGARFITRTTQARIGRSDDISPSMQVLIVKIMQLLLYGTAIIVGLNLTGIDLTGLAVLSGAIGVGLGFGLQKVVSNLVSGVIILMDKSVKPGDVISLGDTFGWINALGARYVSVVTRDGKEYLIPNEDLITSQVVNWSHSNEFVRLDIYFGTAYHDDPHEVRRIAIEAATKVDRVFSPRPPVCHIVGFGDSSIDYILRFWITDPTGGLTNIRGNVYLALWDAFQEHGISIPFPQREVRVLNRPTDQHLPMEDPSDGTASSKSPG